MEMSVAREIRLFSARDSWDIFFSRLSLLISPETSFSVFMAPPFEPIVGHHDKKCQVRMSFSSSSPK